MRQNALLTKTTGSSKNMPTYDKHNGDGARPLMPTLSASAKSASRTPVTPRIAGSGPPPAATTPLPRRGTTPAAAPKESISTPVSAFLNNNITPRSGKRNSRVFDNTNTTPTATPTAAPASPADDLFRNTQDIQTYGQVGGDREPAKRPNVSFGPTVSDSGYSRNVAPSNGGDSKFFFASEAKAAQAPRPQLAPTKSSSSAFVYANGAMETSPAPHSSGASAVGSAIGEERSQPKFFRANGTPDLQPSPILHVQPPKRAGSTISTSSRMNSPMLAQQNTILTPLRSLSPTKSYQPLLPSPRGIPNLSSPLPRPQQIGRGQSASSVVAARRASIENPQRSLSNERSASISSAETSIPRRISSGSSFEPLCPASLVPSLSSLLFSTTKDAREDTAAASDTQSELQSPIKAGHSLERMNELAADARRERKLLDLEITNSSLAAINRTLEREMRKQTAELRRYRRLSRSGRLSIATSASTRTTGENIADGEEGFGLSDMSEGEESEEETEDSDSDSSDDGTLSPNAMAESDLRHRARDEKRLQLDLSKHQQLLTDSQRMNQSLKRCLEWTEELINEGKKALAYNVKVSDIELGGRVLLPEELEEDDEGMSPIGFGLLKQTRLAASAAWGGEGRDDRDSGVELEGPQRSPIHFEHLPQ
ncbi:hypothetical protein BJ878DRAFT_492072 [Calycina marina]|uniref:Uncharacterized protein n=1 Tax=Calycina marina TaxID=1763456 RepID=A0A9P7Z903_9HELO|nr:hypothetical protein BJ878DRAFT_492072 [Calycina marina]